MSGSERRFSARVSPIRRRPNSTACGQLGAWAGDKCSFLGIMLWKRYRPLAVARPLANLTVLLRKWGTSAGPAGDPSREGSPAFFAPSLKKVARAGRLGVEVALVVAIGWKDVWHALDNGDAIPLQRGDLVGVVGEQPHRGKAELAQHLRRWQVDPFVGVEAQLLVG